MLLMSFIIFIATLIAGTVLDVKQQGPCLHGACGPVVNLFFFIK